MTQKSLLAAGPHLLYDMEQPLAAVLGQDGNRGDRRAPDPMICRWKRSGPMLTWNHWARMKEFNINFKTIGVISLKIGLSFNILLAQSRLFNSLERFSIWMHRLCQDLNNAKLLQTHAIGLQDWFLVERKNDNLCTGFDADRPFVQCGSQPKHSCPFNKVALFSAFVPEEENKVLLLGLFTNRAARLGPYFGRWAWLTPLGRYPYIDCYEAKIANPKMWRRTTVNAKAANFCVVYKFPTLDCLTTRVKRRTKTRGRL